MVAYLKFIIIFSRILEKDTLFHANFLVKTQQYFRKIFFFPRKKLKKLRCCSENLKSTFLSLLPCASQTAQIEEFMFQNMAYRATVYRTGLQSLTKWGSLKLNGATPLMLSYEFPLE